MNDAGDVKRADEAVVDDYALRSALTRSLNGKHLNLFNQLSQNNRCYDIKTVGTLFLFSIVLMFSFFITILRR